MNDKTETTSLADAVARIGALEALIGDVVSTSQIDVYVLRGQFDALAGQVRVLCARLDDLNGHLGDARVFTAQVAEAS